MINDNLIPIQIILDADNRKLHVDKENKRVDVKRIKKNIKESHYREWLNWIQVLAYDRDGWNTADRLGKLVDELGQCAIDALNGKECPLNQYKD